MRRIGVIVALSALLGMLGGAVTTTPAALASAPGSVPPTKSEGAAVLAAARAAENFEPAQASGQVIIYGHRG